MKSRITDEQEMRQLNVKLFQEDSEFVQYVLRPELNLPYNAEAVPEVISCLRRPDAQARRRRAQAPRACLPSNASARALRGTHFARPWRFENNLQGDRLEAEIGQREGQSHG